MLSHRSSTHASCRPRIERRADDQAAIVGYASVFYRDNDPGTQYEIWDDLVERIMPGAFDAAIKEDVVRGLTNHDPNWLLGRSDNETVKLSVDKKGLRYEIDLPDTQAGRDTLALIERGDLDGSSFGFRVFGGRRGKVTWSEETIDGKTLEVREIHDLELVDVGPVTFPAYESTTAGVRSEFARVEIEGRKKWREKSGEPKSGEPESKAEQAARRAVLVEGLALEIDTETAEAIYAAGNDS